MNEAEKAQDAIDTLTEEGWIWDGDQWQRPPRAGVALDGQKRSATAPAHWGLDSTSMRNESGANPHER